MAQLNLIPGYGFVADQDQDQLNLIPGYGFSEESPAGGTTITGTLTSKSKTIYNATITTGTNITGTLTSKSKTINNASIYTGFPDGWTRRVALTIDSAQVIAENHTDFTLKITHDDLPSEMFDADGANPAQSDGGDIVITSDSAGTTRLAVHIERFVTDNNPTNGRAEIWVKIPSLSYTADTTIYVWYNTPFNQSQPAVTASTGRNNVYSSLFTAVWPLNEEPSSAVTDVTGNGNDGTGTGFPASAVVSTTIGTGVQFDTGDYVNVGDISPSIASVTFQAWVNMPSSGVGDAIFNKDKTDGSPLRREWQFRKSSSDKLELLIWNQSVSLGTCTSSATIAGALHMVHGTWDGVTMRTYIDGQADGTTAKTGTSINNDSNDAFIGRGENADPGYSSSVISDVRLTKETRSAGWIETEYNNQKPSSTFISTGTPESVGEINISATTVNKSKTVYNAFVELDTGGGSTIDIIGTLTTKGKTVYNATVNIPIAGTLTTKSKTIYNATVSAGSDTNITGTLTSKSKTVYNASVFKDTFITGTLTSKSKTVYPATVGAGRNVVGTLTSKSKTIYNATVQQDTSITGTLTSKSKTIYNATISVGTSITATLTTKSKTIYNATIGAGTSITGTLTSKSKTIYNATVSTSLTVTGTLTSKSKTIYNASVFKDTFITGTLTTKGKTVYPSALGQDRNIVGSKINKGKTVYNATVQADTDTNITGTLTTKGKTVNNATVQALVDINIVGTLTTKSKTVYNATKARVTIGVDGSLTSKSKTVYSATVQLINLSATAGERVIIISDGNRSIDIGPSNTSMTFK